MTLPRFSFIFLILTCISFLFISPACSPEVLDNALPDTPTNSSELPESRIKTVSEQGRYDCDYDSDGNLKEFESNYGAYRITNRCAYVDGYIDEVEGLTRIEQMDKTFDETTNFKCTEFTVDASGIQSCVYESFVSGSVFQTLDLTITCSERDNPLYQSATHCSLIEFTDYFNNLFYYSPKCIESILVEDRNSNNSYSVNYTCLFNGEGEITSFNIDHPAADIARTYTYKD